MKRRLPISLLAYLSCMFFLVSKLDAQVNVIEQDFESIPHQLIQSATKKILVVLDKGLDPVKKPEEFVKEVSIILEPIVAFDYIAKGVMGIYSQRASLEQFEQFSSVFKFRLINTYGKGMSNPGNLSVSISPPAEPVGQKRRVSVFQEIRGNSSASQVVYSMARNRDGEWKMINVIINGVNLGETFRGQFAAAVEKNNGDLGKTINNWDKRG